MKITDFNLLKIDVYNEDEIIYSGMCEDAPDELKKEQIEIIKIQGKKLEVKLKKQV